MTKAFENVATETVSTKRSDDADGKVSAPIENLTGISATPIYPVAPDLQRRMALDTPHTLVECFIEGSYDIKKGDMLVAGGIDYPIKVVEKYPFSGSYRYRLILEDLET